MMMAYYMDFIESNRKQSVPRLFVISSCNITTNFVLLCLQSLWIFLLTGKDQSQTDEQNSLAEGPPMQI